MVLDVVIQRGDVPLGPLCRYMLMEAPIFKFIRGTTPRVAEYSPIMATGY